MKETNGISNNCIYTGLLSKANWEILIMSVNVRI